MNDQQRFIKSEVIIESRQGKRCKITWQLLGPNGGFTDWSICNDNDGMHSIYHGIKYVASFDAFEDAKMKLLEMIAK